MAQCLLARCVGLLFVAAVASSSAALAGVTPRDLKCEYRRNPLGIDASQPRLSWTLASDQRTQQQSAYQVLVASTPELLAAGQGDLWDSGRVESSESLGVVYAGKRLKSGTRADWKVRVWDKDQTPSAFSEPAWWETALVAADWHAAWIRRDKPWPTQIADYYKDDPAPLLRKSFTLAKPIQKARAYVSGLGYYELRINGQRIGDQVLDPGWTTYSKRVLYSTYDVTDALKQGENAVGMMLGNGWYWPLPMSLWGVLNSVSAWFFRSLAGIQPEPDAVGFNKIVIRPRVVGDLTSASAQYNSVRGPVSSAWQNSDNPWTFDVSVPVGITATVYVPATSAEAVQEGGRPAASAPGVEYRRAENGEVVFRVGSGRYHFTVMQ